MGNLAAPQKGFLEDSESQGVCIPVQVGPPTPYALRIRHWSHFILILQAGACIARGVVLLDLLGCFWMVLVCGLGWYAWYHNMHIGYVTMWGMACSLNAVFDVFGFLLPAIIGVVRLQLAATIIRIFTPCTEILGALFAWHLYHDYKIAKGGKPVRDCDPLGRTLEGVDPVGFVERKALNQQGSVGSFFGIAQDYSATQPYGASQPGCFGSSKDYGATTEAQPGSSFNPFQTQPEPQAQERKQNLACC